MHYNTAELTIGMDLGDEFHVFCLLNAAGDIVEEGRVRARHAELGRFLKRYPGARVAMETGTHSPWVSLLFLEAGYEVFVGNSRKLRAIYQSPEKSDVNDARMLARIARFDPRLLAPVVHRGQQAQADLGMVKARDAVVSSRTSLIAHVRSQVKSQGFRIEKCSAAAFAGRALEQLPELLRPALEPLLEAIGRLTATIAEYDRQLAELAATRYPESACLRQVKGVGPLTSLAFMLTVEDARRFPDPRDLGAWLGLTPRRDQSGSCERHLGISKAGNAYLRYLLVEAARYIMGPFGEDCQLRRAGLRLLQLPPGASAAEIKSKSSKAKNRAVVAVARKLAVLLLVLWRRQAQYEPLPQAKAA